MDGLAGTIDLSALIVFSEAGVFPRMRDLALFNQVYLELGTVRWPANWTSLRTRRTPPSRNMANGGMAPRAAIQREAGAEPKAKMTKPAGLTSRVGQLDERDISISAPDLIGALATSSDIGLIGENRAAEATGRRSEMRCRLVRLIPNRTCRFYLAG